jgi:phosphoglycerol transferase
VEVGALVACVLLGSVMLANHLPNLIYRAQHGANASLERQPQESETYGLKIAQMVLPVEHHRLKPLAKLRERYTEHSGSQLNEGQSQALGSIAAAGVIGLLAIALATLAAAWRRPWSPTLPAAGTTIAAILLGTVGGGSALIAYLVTPQLRAWGRISILIAFLGLFAVALAVDRLGARRGPRAAFAVVVALLAIGYFDQTNSRTAPDYAALASSYRSDANFVAGIETALPRGAAVFELPYEPFPEPQPAWVPEGMGPYDMARPYLHSRDLRWSYGLMKGRGGDWQAALVQLPPALVARAVAAVGFKGIYVDRFGFADRGTYLTDALVAETRATPAGSPDAAGRLAFLDLQEYAKRVRGTHSPGQVKQLRDAVLRPLTTEFGAGYSALRQSARARFYLTDRSATLTFHNPYLAARAAVFSAGFASATGRPAEVTLSVKSRAATRRTTIQVGPEEGPREIPLTLAPGDTQLTMDVKGRAQYAFPQVTRPYYLRVENPVLIDVAFKPFGEVPRDRRAAAFLSPFGPI